MQRKIYAAILKLQTSAAVVFQNINRTDIDANCKVKSQVLLY